MSAISSKGRTVARLALWLCTPLLVAHAHADQWYTEPRVSLYGFYEDNIGLDTRDEISSPGYILRGSMKGGRRSENTDINLSGEVERRQYFDDSDRDTNDFHLDGQAIHRIERDRFELNAAYDFDSTLTSEVSTSGRVQNQERRKRWYLGPAWERQLTERLAVNAEASYQDVSYDNGERYGLFDYSYGTLGGGFSFSIDERTQAITRLSYDRYEADGIDNESDTYGVLAGVGYALEENWSITALLGVRHSKTDNALGSDSSTGGQFDISTDRKFETGTLSAGFSRGITPSGSGGVLNTTGLNVSWNQQIVPRWRWVLRADAYRNELPSGDSSSQDRDFYSIAPRLSYAVDRDWNLEAGYRYRYQKYDNDSDSADANAVFFTIAYRPKRERPDLDLTR